MDVVFVLDRSRSTLKCLDCNVADGLDGLTDTFETSKTMLKDLVAEDLAPYIQSNHVQLSVISFGTEAKLEFGFQDNVTNLLALIDKIEAPKHVRARQYTNLTGAMKLIEHVNNPDHKFGARPNVLRFLLTFTDGEASFGSGFGNEAELIDAMNAVSEGAPSENVRYSEQIPPTFTR